MNDQNERSHFDLWNIRDAIINGIHFDWQAGDLVIALIAFLTAGENRAARFLVFEGVRNLGYSRKMPWGSSTRVNRIYRTK